MSDKVRDAIAKRLERKAELLNPKKPPKKEQAES